MEHDIHDRLDRARAITREGVEKAASGLKQGAEKLGKRARSAGARAGKRVEGARIQAGRAADQANRLATEHPMAAIAAAVAVGAMVAWLLPKGRQQKAAADSEQSQQPDVECDDTSL